MTAEEFGKRLLGRTEDDGAQGHDRGRPQREVQGKERGDNGDDQGAQEKY